MEERHMMYATERRNDLLSRLHLAAENSDVLQMVSRNTAMHKQPVNPNEHRLSFIPKPPSENTEKYAAIRTFIYKEDRTRRSLGKLKEDNNILLL
uniref:Uncharacterized protein n=2 Tax=Pyxicephalus adspersus TaxID=30357 RepID=A0AAV3AS69_PYXAD|nr:TPA: hypothetical protein GDO54_011468 [Pyxicephalus adspersus]